MSAAEFEAAVSIVLLIGAVLGAVISAAVLIIVAFDSRRI